LTSRLDADVVVVGGGPAGSVMAGLLARQGHDVMLLDRANFPRGKPCGESVNPGAVRELERLGLLQAVRAHPHETIDRWVVHAFDGPTFEGRFRGADHGLAIDRSLFDKTLLDFARAEGVRVITGTRVTDLLLEQGHVVGVQTIDGSATRARLVVGADGLRSVVVRRLGLVRESSGARKIALTAHVEAPEVVRHTGVLSLTSWGCVGIAPIGGGIANVVVVIDRPAEAEIDGEPDACFDRLVAGNPYLCGAKRACAVKATGPFDVPTRGVTANGALLVGDAAGYFDPLTGQGIFRALRGAQVAAEVAGTCLRSGRTSRPDMAAYERQSRRDFAGGIRIQRLIEFAIRHPPLFLAFAGLLRSRPTLADRVVAVTGDLLPPSRLLLPRPAEAARS